MIVRQVGRVGASNLQNLRRVVLVDVAQVISMRNSLDLILVAGSISVIESGDAVINFWFPQGDASYEVKTTGSDIFEGVVIIPCPHDYEDAARMERQVAGRKWVAVMETMNGEIRVLGSVEYPLRGVVEYSSATAGRVFRLTNMSKLPVFFCEAETIEAVFASGGFSGGFSRGFNI